MKISATTLLLLICLPFASFAQMQRLPGEILVQMKPGSNPQQFIQTLAQGEFASSDLRIDRQLSKPMNIHLIKFDAASTDDRALLGVVKNSPQVLNAQYNHLISRRETTPDDPGLVQQWHHINNGTNNGLEDADIDSDLAWDITTGGTTFLGDTIVVCIIEGGNLLHPELIGNAWFNHNEIPGNGIDDDENGYIDDFRGWNVGSNNDNGVYDGGHGTNVMGMIGAKGNNGSGTVGANWNVKMMSVAGENIGNEASVVEAYTYPLVQRQLYEATGGERGAFVVVTNASWGIDNGDPADVPIWSAFYDTLGVYGILNCGATANNNVNIDIVGDIPTAVPSDYMISVTATNSNDVRTFSGFGIETVDLGAPGQNVYTTAGTGGYTTTSGTSFASPLTAGVVALLYAAPCSTFAQLVHDNPQAGADYVRFALFEGVDPVANLQNETATGGRINAFNSLQILMNNCTGDICLPPFGFNFQLAEDTVYTFSWTLLDSAASATIRYRIEGTTDWTYTATEDESAVFDTLAYCTTYEFQIANACSEDTTELNFAASQLINTKGCCINTQAVQSTSSAEDSIAISWVGDFAIPDYTVSYRPTGSGLWILAGTSDNGNFDISGLDACTYYDIEVKAGCLDENEEGTITTIRTKGCGHCIDEEFCPGAGESSFFEYIESVEIGTYTNNSGNDGGYVLFEETGLELELAGTYTITLTPGFSGQAYAEYFTAWIDFDQNGIFEESEVIIESEAGSNDLLSGEMSIPASAMLGATRLRISMKYVGGPIVDDVEACEVYNEGETEDYCLTIIEETVGLSERLAANVPYIFPNPAAHDLQINYNGYPRGNDRLAIFDMSGRLIMETQISNSEQRVSLSELVPAVYTYVILTENGQRIAGNKLVVIR